MKGRCGEALAERQQGPNMRRLHVQKPAGQGRVYINEGDVHLEQLVSA